MTLLECARRLTMLVVLGICGTGQAAADAPPAAQGGNAAAPPVTPPAAAPVVSPAPALICSSGSASEIKQALESSEKATPQKRLASRFRFLPLQSDADILVFAAPEQGLWYRAVLVYEGAHKEKDQFLIDSSRISAEPATTGEAGADFKQSEDKTAKTLLRFAPDTSNFFAFWEPTRIYVIACSANNSARYYGQLSTNLTTRWLSVTLALVLCGVLYVLAAFATFYIHRAQRAYKGTDINDLIRFGRKGTNYAPLLHHFNPVVLTAGGNGRGSATKLQILFFSLVVFGLVSYVWMSTGYLSDLSSTILLLMGISGLGATVSTATDVSKSRLDFDNWAWLINRHWLPKGGVAEANRAQWKDIVMTDGEFDVYRFQMIIFSVLVGMALIGAGGKMAELSTFTIPSALLGILGLSQVVYIGGKLAAPPTIAQLNDQISKLRTAETGLKTALNQRDPAAPANVLALLPLDRAELMARVGDLYDKYLDAWETTRTMFESTLSREVSAVAAGFRPPFPYMSAPDKVLDVLLERYAAIDNKLQAQESTWDTAKSASVAAARSAVEAARKTAESLRQDFETALKNSQATQLAADETAANDLVTKKELSEAAVRNALDVLRQRIEQLGQLAGP